MNEQIIIKGARENNLKNIDLSLPKNKLIVMTGLSGSGKTSLAFDTIYEEGRRRYVESLSAYARQFLGNMEKPDVDSIEGLSPAISIDQKQRPIIPDQRLEPLLKFMIMFDFYMRESEYHIVQFMASKLPVKPSKK